MARPIAHFLSVGRKALLLAGLLLASTTAVPAAAPDRVSVLIGSHHTEDYPFEEFNPGLFLIWEDRAFGLDYSLGAFRNSFGGGSVSALAAFEILAWGTGEVSLVGSLAWYPGRGDHFYIHAGDLAPVAGLQVRQGPVWAQLMPGKMDPPEAILAFGLTFPIGK